MTESRFFTDEERQAMLVEAALAGDIDTCVARDCGRKYVKYDAVQFGGGALVCPDCLRRVLVQEHEAARNRATTYLNNLKSQIDGLEGIIWEQRWLPN